MQHRKDNTITSKAYSQPEKESVTLSKMTNVRTNVSTNVKSSNKYKYICTLTICVYNCFNKFMSRCMQHRKDNTVQSKAHSQPEKEYVTLPQIIKKKQSTSDSKRKSKKRVKTSKQNLRHEVEDKEKSSSVT